MRMVSATSEFAKKTSIRPEALVFWCFAGVFLTMPMGTSPPIILGALGTAIWLFSGMAFRVRAFLKQSWFWPVLVFITLAWIGLLYTPDLWGFGINYAGKTYYWLFCLALASLFSRNLRPQWLINAFLLGLAVNACVGILQLVGLIPTKQGWFSGLTRGYNTLTVYLVLGILVCAFYMNQIRGWKKRCGPAALMGLYFFHLVILEGRTGYLTFIILSPLWIKTLFKHLRLWKLAAVFALIIGVMSFSPIVRERTELTIKQIKYHMNAEPNKAWGKEYTVHQDRFYFWQGAMELFLENPMVGVGTGGYPKTLKERRSPDDPVVAHPHNNLLHMAVSHGVLGLLVFFWLFGEMFRNGWKEGDTLIGHFVLCSSLVLFVNGLFNTTVLDAGTLLLLSLTVGFQRALPEFSEAGHPEPTVIA